MVDLLPINMKGRKSFLFVPFLDNDIINNRGVKMNIKKVGMIGRGAVGTLFANLIQKEIGNENFFFIVGEDRIRNYEENPFYLNGKLCDFCYRTPCHAKPLDLLIISTKYPVLMQTLETIRPFVSEDTIILCLLNGISSEKIVEETLQKGIVIHSIAQMMDAQKDKTGVTYTKVGEIVIGTNKEEKQVALKEVSQFLEKVKIPYHIANDIIYEQWSKLMLNCGINQICAVYDVTYEGCQKEGKYHNLFIEVMREVAKVAAYQGVELTENDIQNWEKAVDGLSKDSMPSMRQDTRAKRYSEVDLFSKTIIDLAHKHHINVPLNEDLYHKIKLLESKY